MSQTQDGGHALAGRTRVITVVFEFDLDVADRISPGFPAVMKANTDSDPAGNPANETIHIGPLPKDADRALLDQRMADLALAAQSVGYASALLAKAIGVVDR